jgi:hypothetical protein
MKFGSNHYMPVLKVKRGEKAALQAIPVPLRAGITPLLEIVQHSHEKPLKNHIDTTFAGLQSATCLYTRCLIDAKELEPDGAAAAQAVFHHASRERIVFTPVTGISRTADLAAALAHSSHGIAIRLTRKELDGGVIPRALPGFMATHRLNHAQVDLIVDLGTVDQMVQDGVSALANAFLDAIPNRRLWRTLTLSGCGFPLSMGVVGRESHKHVERTEWRMWRDCMHANRRTMERLPTYSDCGIQHTKGVEGFDPIKMQASATIRYTTEQDWLLIKGIGTRTTPPSQQFPGLANQLVYGGLRRSFAGASHCSGCAGMKAAADGEKKLGSPEIWRRLGTIHHITTVVKALAALPWP